jgi:chromosome segregation ATPase
LTKEKSQFQSDRNSLEKAFQQEKEKLERLVSFREKEHARFEESKNELEMTIVYEKIKVKNLSSQLEQEDLAFRNKIKALEEGIAVEKANIAKVEAQLEQEQAHTNELSTLRDELDKEKNLRRSERKALSRKTRETKSMLKSRLQEVKEKAKDEQKSLPEKYEKQISDAKNSVTKLELDWEKAQKSSEELRATLEEMNGEKNLLITEREGAEARYKRTLDHRDGTIAELRSEMETLYDDIYEREQKIEKYEESFDELFALAMQITKRRMDEVFGMN